MTTKTDVFESDNEIHELEERELDQIAGGGQGGKKGRCPGCGSDSFQDLGGGKIRCRSCGWEGTKASIGL